MNYSSLAVVVTIYNKESYIPKLVQMLEQQTVQPDEVVFVDDASTDNSLSVLKKILFNSTLQTNSKIVINEKNIGPSGARNLGVSAANSDYVCLLDADDWWDSDYLLSVSSLIRRNKFDLLGLGYDNSSNMVIRTTNISSKLEPYICNINYFYKRSLLFQIPFTCSSSVVKRDSFFKIGGFKKSLRNGEDQVLWTEFCNDRNYVCLFYPEVLAHYRLEVSNSASKIKKDKNWLMFLKDLKKTDSIYCDLYLIKLIAYFSIHAEPDEILSIDSKWFCGLIGYRFLAFFVYLYFAIIKGVIYAKGYKKAC